MNGNIRIYNLGFQSGIDLVGLATRYMPLGIEVEAAIEMTREGSELHVVLRGEGEEDARGGESMQGEARRGEARYGWRK